MPVQNPNRLRAGMAFNGRRTTTALAPRSAVGTFFDGFQDSISFGFGDQLKAGLGAAYDAYNGQSGMAAYWRRIRAQHEQDRIDAEQRAAARNWGKGVGTALQLLGAGPIGGLVRGGRV